MRAVKALLQDSKTRKRIFVHDQWGRRERLRFYGKGRFQRKGRKIFTWA